MYRRVLAFDFDGTLATEGTIPPALQKALTQVHQSGCAFFLVTGRRFESIDLGPLAGLFTGIVWENGAVLERTATHEVSMPFGYVGPHVIRALETADVPLEHGMAMVATWSDHEETVWRVLSEQGGDIAVVPNKGAIMILPPGATKGTGLERLLHLCGYSPRNMVGFGDGENDLSLLQVGEAGIAVADAVDSLKAVADLVTDRPGPAGVLQTLKTFWLDGSPLDIASQHPRWIPLGNDEYDSPFFLPCDMLAGHNFGVFGDPASGKSWVTGLLSEGMHLSGYQMVLIDPEGNFRGMRAFPGVISLDAAHGTLISPGLIATLLEEASISFVVDLSSFSAEQRNRYVIDLLSALHPLRKNKFRPHWIVLEEAQHFFMGDGDAVTHALLPLLDSSGIGLVSYNPREVPYPLLKQLDHVILTRLSEAGSQEIVRNIFSSLANAPLAEIPQAHILLDGQHRIRLRPEARRIKHIRHLYKYLDMPLPAHKRFQFASERGSLGLQAASLFEFVEILPALPLESIVFHQKRGDFAAWARSTLGDEELADQLDKLSRRSVHGEALRDMLVKRVNARYAELHALR